MVLNGSTYCDTVLGHMENKPQFRPNPKLKFMDQPREVLR